MLSSENKLQLIVRFTVFLILLGGFIISPLRFFYLPLLLLGLALCSFPVELKKFFRKQLFLLVIGFSHLFLFGYFVIDRVFLGGGPIFQTEHFIVVLNLFYRTAGSYLVVSFFNSLNSFSELLATLKILRFPPLIIMLFTISYRLVHIFDSRVRQMLIAYRLRTGGKQRPALFLQMLKSALFKSFASGNRITGALKSRNFHSNLDFRKIK